MTAAGVILGTAAYLSPEQARGKPVDRRADIWAFGCVLYEMLTGARLFRGETVSDTIGSILRDEPDWKRLPVHTPSSVRKLLARCLQKDARQRLPHIGSARFELEDARDPDAPTVTSRPAPGARRLVWPAVAAILALTTLGLGLAVVRQPRVEPPQATVSLLQLPENTGLGPQLRFALSPNGQRLAVAAPDASGRNVLWVRPLTSLTAQPLAGTEGVSAPFWSPDSRHIAFNADGRIKRIDASGGSIITLAENSAGGPGSWSRSDTILFTDRTTRQLVRVSANGGQSSPVTSRRPEAGTAYFPWFLPDGEHFIYLFTRALYVSSLTGREDQLLLEDVGNAAVGSGQLLFLRDDTLYARPFDVDRRQLLGDAVPVAERVEINTANGAGAFAVSNTGVLVFQSATATPSRLVWLDRSGREAGVLGEAGQYSDMRLSRDGRWVVASIFSGAAADRDIWLLDVQRGLRTRVTSGRSDDTVPLLSVDGSRVIFTARRGALKSLQMIAANGQGEPTTLIEDPFDKSPQSWSADGRLLLYTRLGGPTSFDIWTIPWEGGGSPAAVIQTNTYEGRSEFSPDGRFIAYESMQSGRREVYVTTYPDRSRMWPVSAAGGSHPHWRQDGNELYFVNGTSLMRAPVIMKGAGIDIGVATPLIDVALPLSGLSSQIERIFAAVSVANVYDVSPDGQRFLFNIPLHSAPDAVTLVVNWPQLAAASR